MILNYDGDTTPSPNVAIPLFHAMDHDRLMQCHISNIQTCKM